MVSIWQRTKQILHSIGDFQARLLLTLLYAIFVAPLGVALRLSDDLLRQRPTLINGSYWQTKQPLDRELRNARSQG